VPIELYRIDDRLIHGQVVVGWGRPLDIGFVVLVDDEVAASDWEQELYRMGVPPEMDVYFHAVPEAAAALADYQANPRPGIVLTGDVETMRRLALAVAARDGGRSTIRAVNLGGVHHRRADAAHALRLPHAARGSRAAALAAQGIAVTAQDVPSARPVPLETSCPDAATARRYRRADVPLRPPSVRPARALLGLDVVSFRRPCCRGRRRGDACRRTGRAIPGAGSSSARRSSSSRSRRSRRRLALPEWGSAPWSAALFAQAPTLVAAMPAAPAIRSRARCASRCSRRGDGRGSAG
jgi:PTS system mannose-specific IIB component/fructoselysine and glucoselysine-specific PTS system IIB component